MAYNSGADVSHISVPVRLSLPDKSPFIGQDSAHGKNT